MDVDKDYAADIMKTLFKYSGEKKFTDFKIRAGGRTAHCHQGVLSAKSSYFHALCSSGLREAKLDNPLLKQEDGEVLESVVKFLYLGKCDITSTNVESLLIAADFIQLGEMKTKCEEFMTSKLSPSNLLSYHKLSKKTGLTDLCSECERLSKNSFSEVSRSDWILSLSPQELHNYLMDETLNVKDEDDVLAAVQLWLDNVQDENAPRVIEDIFPCIRVQFCSPARLEAMSKDATLVPLLRLKISDYRLHGWHAEGAPRPSYSAACRARHGAGTARNPSSATPPKRAAGALHKAPKPSPSAPLPADDTEEVLLIGGYTSDPSHKNIVFMDRDPDTSVLCSDTMFSGSVNYSVCVDQGSLIFSGGYDYKRDRTSSKVKIFNINGNTWSDLTNLPHPAEEHGSALLNGNFFCIGGRYRDANKTNHLYHTVHRLDIRAGTWSECPGLPKAVARVGIATVGKDIMVIGGRAEDGWSTQTCRYNTTTNTMTTCKPMPKSDYVYCSTVAKDHRVFVLSYTLFLSYDVRTDQWCELQLPSQPSFTTAMVLKQQKLIALGGFDEDEKNPNDRIQVYDIGSNTWSVEDKKMPLKLCMHWAVVVPKTA